MAPQWVSRFTLNHANRPSNPPSSTTAGPAIPQSPSVPTTNPLLLLPDQATIHASTIPFRRGHARSTSNPFPAFLTSRRNGSRHRNGGFIDSDFTDGEDELHPTVPSARSCSPQKHAPIHPEDVQIRKCMTCDHTNSFPSNKKGFRCGKCTAMNDLEPRRSRRLGTSERLHPHIQPRPKVTLEETRSIIEHCLTSYLCAELGESRVRRPSSKLGCSPPRQGVARSQNISPIRADDIEVDALSDLSYDAPLAPKNATATSTRFEKLERAGESELGKRNERARSPTYQRDSKKESRADLGRNIGVFQTLENYILTCFDGCDTLNVSFLTGRSRYLRAASEGSQPAVGVAATVQPTTPPGYSVSNLDEKTILLGSIAENGSWWAQNRLPLRNPLNQDSRSYGTNIGLTSSRSPRIDWAELIEWYRVILHAGEAWKSLLLDDESGVSVVPDQPTKPTYKESAKLARLHEMIMESQFNVRKTLLRATERLLQRPKRPLMGPDDIRCLLILLENPLLYSSNPALRAQSDHSTSPRKRNSGQGLRDASVLQNNNPSPEKERLLSTRLGELSSMRYSILKKLFGLISNLPSDCHRSLVIWFSRLPPSHFQRLVELVNGFVSFRLGKCNKRRLTRVEPGLNLGEYVPTFSSPGTVTPAQLHTALQRDSPSKSPQGERKLVSYAEDWQIRAAARVMALLFRANSTSLDGRKPSSSARDCHPSVASDYDGRNKIAIACFYNMRLDYADLILDFDAWETQSGKFSFCQYSFFLSIWAKIQIMEYDARRQMEAKAREAFFDTILGRRGVSQYLVLKVRRDCLVEDSLQSVSAVVGSGEENIKKGLRIEFSGEEGIDAGGLRKEWFLLLVREVFDPLHGLFLYDADSRYCYFNPYCFESSEQFFLVGVVLGLAIYNSTILDVALPPFAFRKLLAFTPPGVTPALSSPPQAFKPTLDDLAEFRPALARGLRQLLEYDGDVAETFCQVFALDVERYGEVIQVPLCAGGEQLEVTNENRHNFVELYVQYVIDKAVSRQFEPFRRGFFTVCGGNALQLFRPEEIELLVRGSEEPLDIPSLRGVAVYEHWPATSPEREPVVTWFWDFFERITVKDQRKLLGFITGSDRLPAMGAVNLVIRIICLGPDSERFPIARTCFNSLSLYRYKTRAKLEDKLWRAVVESGGFGLQ